MPGRRYSEFSYRAADRFGFVTSRDARELGIPVGTLNAMAHRGQLERVAHGIYRVPLIPPSPLDQYMLATLWPQERGRISHESALDLYGMGDVNPDKIHLTVPVGYRTHREIPALYVLHREELADEDTSTFEGVPIVSPARALRQAHARSLRRSLLEQAIDDGAQHGWLRRREAEQLRSELVAAS